MIRKLLTFSSLLLLAGVAQAHGPEAGDPGLIRPQLDDCAWPCEDPSLPLELDTRGGDQPPFGLDWELLSTTPEATFYRQTFQGIPIYDTQLVDLPTTPWKRFAYRAYPLELLKVHFGNRPIARGDSQAALQAASDLWPGAELRSELQILPLRGGPRLTWRIKNLGPDGSPGDGSTLLVEVGTSLPMAILRPEVWGVGEVPRGEARCPDLARFEHGEGKDLEGNFLCFPAAYQDPPVASGRFAIMNTYLGSDDVTFSTYYPPGEISVVEAGDPQDDWLPKTRPLGIGTINNNFTGRFKDAVSAQYLLFQAFDFWQRSSLRPLLFPRADREIRAVTRVVHSSAYWDLDQGYFGFPFSKPEHFTLDVVGHEYGHALNGRLESYSEGSARIANEAVADYLGLMLESGVASPAGSSVALPLNWLVGEHPLRNLPIRDLRQPSRTRNLSHFWQFPNGGTARCHVLSDPPTNHSPHTLATIVGHAFFLMVEGGFAEHDAVCPAPAVSSALSFEEVGRIAFWLNYNGISDALAIDELLEKSLAAAASVGLDEPAQHRTIEQAFRAVGLPDLEIIDRTVSVERRDLRLPKYFEIIPNADWDPRERSLAIHLKGPAGSSYRAAVHLEHLPDVSRCIGNTGPLSPYCFDFEVANGEGDAELLVPLNPYLEQVYLVVDPGGFELSTLDLDLEAFEPKPLPNHETSEISGPPKPGTPETFKIEIDPAPQQFQQATAQTLRLVMSGGTGNADLFLKRGSVPTPRDFDYGSPVAGNEETIIVENPPPGDWYVSVYPRPDFAAVSLKLSYGLAPPEVSRPDEHFPSYQLGDVARLEIRTDPPQPGKPVYSWRLLDGEVEREASPLQWQDEQGNFFPYLTSDAGELELELQLPVDAFDLCGHYTDERFAVGSTSGPQSQPLEYVVECPGGSQSGGVTAVRPDGHFPSYRLGDMAQLHLTTFPPRPGERVYGWRLKDGAVERDGVVLQYDDAEGRRHDYLTDENGELLIELTLSDPSVCGSYSQEQFAVGDPNSARSAPASFTVECSNP
ncbi:MAG: pre-peptidase C-terminal domain-containing protein [Acidobacteriota bacterium]